jgi:hypothetical protein
MQVSDDGLGRSKHAVHLTLNSCQNSVVIGVYFTFSYIKCRAARIHTMNAYGGVDV